MTIAAILLVNMLIAMMGNTYQMIAEQKNEWMRQVFEGILVGQHLQIWPQNPHWPSSNVNSPDIGHPNYVFNLFGNTYC
jgi:hypothetical protein